MKKSLFYSLFAGTILFLSSCGKDAEPTGEPDVVAPTVTFSIEGFPDSNSNAPVIVSNQIEISIDAQDAGGISKIEAFINDEKVGEDTTAPYQMIIDVSSLSSKVGKSSKYKDYILKVVATDKSGNETSTQKTINVDNEMPSITEVSLLDGTIINGEENLVSFNVTDNEEVSTIKAYLNNELISEVTPDDLEISINTLTLDDGENILKIEAIDTAENIAAYTVNFISDNTGPDINLESFTANQILDAEISLAPVISDPYSAVTSTEILLDGNSLQSFQNPENISLDLDPENYSVGEHELQLTTQDDLGNSSSIEIPFDIYRRMITINIPEDRLNAAIVLPVVFLSRMDGSLLAHQEILREDRQIILRVAEEFDMGTEFMLSFFLQDNGGSTGISTHQNLTRNNPGTLNLATPNRWVEAGLGPQIPTINFFTGDNLIVSSGDTHHSPWWLSASTRYSGYLNTNENFLYIGEGVSETNPSPFDSFYLYESNNSSSYKYLFLDNPIENGYVLDKNNLISTGVETRSLTVNSSNATGSEYTNLLLFGALTEDDVLNNRYHHINHKVTDLIAGNPMNYEINTAFPNFKHSLLFGKYYTERNGPPEVDYNIPDLSLSYSDADNVVSLSIQGSEHIVGRIQCIDLENPNYDWYITFNSQTTTDVIIPDLPQNISHPIVDIQNNANVKVEAVELLSYQSIVDYNDYLERVTKNQKSILDVTDWYQLVYASRTGNFNRPHLEFIFF